LIAKLRLPKRGPRTIVTKTALRVELERIAADGGVAVEDEELLAGRRGLAVVVVDGEDAAVAAVELAVPAQAYARERLLKELGPRVAATARRITVALG
jgi:DNA-binding IclR family transcriptional regulator